MNILLILCLCVGMVISARAQTISEITPTVRIPFEGYIYSLKPLQDGGMTVLSFDVPPALWASDGTKRADLIGHSGFVNGIEQLADGRLLTWAFDNTLRLWDVLGNPLAVWTFDVSYHNVKPQADGTLFAIGDGVLTLLEGDGQVRWQIDLPFSGVEDAHLFDATRVLVISFNHPLSLWHTDGQLIRNLELWIEAESVYRLADGRFVTWLRYTNIPEPHRVFIWDMDGNLQLRLLDERGDVMGVTELASNQLLVWGQGGMMRLWDVTSGDPLREVGRHTDVVFGVRQLPNGRIASWSEDGTARLRDLQTGYFAVIAEDELVRDVFPLPNDRMLVVYGNTGRMDLLDVDGRLLARLSMGAKAVIRIIVLADGRLATLDIDAKEVAVWDIAG